MSHLTRIAINEQNCDYTACVSFPLIQIRITGGTTPKRFEKSVPTEFGKAEFLLSSHRNLVHRPVSSRWREGCWGGFTPSPWTPQSQHQSSFPVRRHGPADLCHDVSPCSLPILNSIGTSRGSSRMFSRLFLRQQRAGYVYNWPGAWPGTAEHTARLQGTQTWFQHSQLLNRWLGKSHFSSFSLWIYFLYFFENVVSDFDCAVSEQPYDWN